MNARDIMSSPVLSVAPDTPVLEVAALLQERRIGGVPVVAADRLVGIVTERDLLHRRELGTVRTSRDPTWWRRMVTPQLAPDLYVKTHGRCARHVMTQRVVVVDPGTSLQEITLLFERNAIGRVPVVEHDRLVGMIAAADLVRALSRGAWMSPVSARDFGDSAITAALLEELRAQEWWNANICAVEVSAGVVRFTGFCENESQRRASRVAAENIPGVQGIVDERQLTAELPVAF